MRKVGQIMKSPVITVKPTATVADLVDLTRRHRIRHFPVVENDALVGIVTDRNIREASDSPRLFSLILDLIAVMDKAVVEEIMVRDVVTIGPEASVQDAARLMAERKIGSLPVVKDGKLVGIITVIDLLQALTAEGSNRPTTPDRLSLQNSF